MAVERSFRSGTIVETVETKSVLSQGRLGSEVGTSPAGLWRIRDRVREVAKSLVSRDHLETVREGGDVAGRVGWICIQKVVSATALDVVVAVV